MENQTIASIQSPYFVEPHKSPQRAIKLAIENGLSPNKIIDDYLYSKRAIPIHVVETACNINLTNIQIPIKYQYLWFCLDKVKVSRKASETRIVNPRVSFHPIYIEPKKHILKLFEKALKSRTKTELARLCSVEHRQIIYQWVTGKIRPQITGLIKVCQLLNRNVWEVLHNCKLYGHSCPEEESMTFLNYPQREILDVLAWIKLEGHLAISQPRVETNQKDVDKAILDRFSKRITQLYKLNPKRAFIYDNSTQKGTIKDWKGFKLTISSAPLRQILCLRYGIPLGYKCSFINLTDELNSCDTDEAFYRLLSTCIETEGSITQKKEKSYFRPLITFTSISKLMIDELASACRGFDYHTYTVNNPSRKAYDFRIWGLNSFVKCCFDIFPYFTHHSKLKRALGFLSDSVFLDKLWIKPSAEVKSLILKARSKFKTPAKNRELARNLSLKLNKQITRHNVNGWLNLNKSINLSVLNALCDLEQEDCFKYIPKYLALVLWTNKYIKRECLEDKRRIKDSFKHVEEIRDGL